MRVRSLGQEDPLEKEMVTHSSILKCLRNPMDRGAWWATVHGIEKRQTRLNYQIAIKETPSPLALNPQPLATNTLLSGPVDLPILDVSRKWDHTLCGLL